MTHVFQSPAFQDSPLIKDCRETLSKTRGEKGASWEYRKVHPHPKGFDFHKLGLSVLVDARPDVLPFSWISDLFFRRQLLELRPWSCQHAMKTTMPLPSHRPQRLSLFLLGIQPSLAIFLKQKLLIPRCQVPVSGCWIHFTPCTIATGVFPELEVRPTKAPPTYQPTARNWRNLDSRLLK